jgi:hypothetical protein
VDAGQLVDCRLTRFDDVHAPTLVAESVVDPGSDGHQALRPLRMPAARVVIVSTHHPRHDQHVGPAFDISTSGAIASVR